LSTFKITQTRRKEILPQTSFSLSAGQNGFQRIPFDVTEIRPQETINFVIRVTQPSGRTDLDIGFSVMDDDNFQKWLLRQPNSAFVIAPRFILGTLKFMPQAVGRYYAVLDNRYSILTGKGVFCGIYETWQEEKEVRVPTPQSIEEKPKPKVGLLRRFWNRMRSNKALGLIALFATVAVLCAFLAVGIAMLFHYTLGVQYADTMGYLTTAIGGSTVVILISLYFLVTGRPLPQQTSAQS
jgi:hypothetical protein